MTVVDYQTHWLPPAALKLFEQRTSPPRVRKTDAGYVFELSTSAALPLSEAHTDLGGQLGTAAEAGIDVLVSSPNLLGEVLDLPALEATELLNSTNGLMASAQSSLGGSFFGLAMLPMQDSEAALAVLDQAHRLGLGGVCMLPTIAGQPVATEATLPVFRRIEALGMPLFLHPEARNWHPSANVSRTSTIGAGWMYATALAALNLIESGTLDQCPDLIVVHHHLGGVLPWVHGRIDRISGKTNGPTIADYLRTRFYVDSVSATPGALGFAIDLYGSDKVLFASDYPYMPMPMARAFVEDGDAVGIYDNRLPGLPVGG